MSCDCETVPSGGPSTLEDCSCDKNCACAGGDKVCPCICVEEGGVSPCECSESPEDNVTTPAAPSFDEMMEKMQEQREELLKQVDKCLQDASGQLPSRKALLHSIQALRSVVLLHEKLLQAVTHDMMVLVNQIGRTDSVVFQLSTTIAALVTCLSEKDLVSQEEVHQAFTKVVADMKKTVEEAGKSNE